MSDELAKEKQVIEEALRFIGEDKWDSLDVEVMEGIVKWGVRLSVTDYMITGMHRSGDETQARISTIMTISLARHMYGQLIFDLLQIVEKAMHTDPTRNTLFEIVMRFMIVQMLRKGVPGAQVKEKLLAKVNFQKNLTEAALFVAAMSHSRRKN